MESEVASSQPSKAKRPRWRTWVAMTLIVLACIVAIPATALAWTNRELTDTDTYVDTIAPLINEASVQQAFADKITTAIFNEVDLNTLVTAGVDALEDAGVPPRLAQALDGLSDPLESAVQGYVNREVMKLLASAWVARLWVELNAVAHTELAAALAGDDTKTLRIDGNDLIANTGALSREVKQRLVDRGLGFANILPTINTNVTLLSSPQIAEAKSRYQQLTFLGTFLPWLVIGLLIGGLAFALNRRHAALVAGLGLAIAMAVLALLIKIGEGFGVDAIPSNILPRDAATDTVTLILSSIWRPIWFIFAVGIVVAIVAYLTGPAQPAVQFRDATVKGLSSLRSSFAKRGWKLAPVDSWAHRFATPLLIGVAAFAVLILLLWNSPTWGVVVWVSLLAGLFALIIGFFAVAEPAHHHSRKSQALAR